jgi:OmpA-OmpF porin, OOP family
MNKLYLTNRARSLRHCGWLILLAVLPSVQAADTDFETGSWYLGAGVGKSRASIDQQQIALDLQNAGFTVNNVSRDRRDDSYKLYGGYQLMPYLALEGGYFDLGEFSFRADTVPMSLYAGETSIKGINLALVGTLPLTDQLSALAKLGLTYNDSDTRFSSNGLVGVNSFNSSTHYTSHQFGVGLAYQLTTALALRLEAERYRIDDLVGNKGDIDVVTLGLTYRYGLAEPYYEPTPAPEPAAQSYPESTPSPAPVAPVEEQLPMTSGVIELEDVHFEFDESRLTPATQAILREHLQKLKANPTAKVRIAGYTSKSGSESYNQRLSEQRAEAIKTFLVAEGIASPDRLTTIGFGEHQSAEFEANPTQLRSDAAKANMRVLFEITVE